MGYSIIKKSLLAEDFRSLLSYKPLQFLISTIIVWFLMFFLTLIVWLSSHLNDVSQWLSWKLGMYFYLTSQAERDISPEIVQLLKELDSAGIKAEYLSEEDAMNTLEQKLPAIVQEFKNYNIDPNLPSTLYVMINDDYQHKQLTRILPKYSSIITNLNDLNWSSSIRDQEQRVMRAIQFSRFLQKASITLIMVFSIIVLVTIWFLLYLRIKQFEDIMELKSILWASNHQLRMPFLLFVGTVLLGGLALSFALTLLLGLVSSWQDQSLIYFSQLLWFNATTGIWSLLFSNYGIVVALILIIALITRLISYLIIEYKIKKL